jgi:general secretion pathway protein G
MLLSFSLALLTGSTPTLPIVDVESFIPANAYAVVRARSIDDLSRILGTFGRAVDEPVDVTDPAKMMKDMLGIEVRMDLVDRTKPILYCMVASGTASPFIPTCVMHVKDAAGFAASEGLKDSPWKCHTEGDIAVLSQGSDAVAAHEVPAFAKDIGKYDVVARVDMVSVMKTWGDELTGMVDGLEGEAEGQEPSAAEAVSSMVDGVHTALEGLSTFEVHASMKGDEMTFGLEAVAKENSKLAGYAVNEPNGLLDLARGIDGDAPFVMLQCFDYGSILQTYDKLYSEFLEKMPEQQQKQMKAMLGTSRDLYAAMGRSMAASFALDGHGLHGSFCLHPKDAAALPKTYQAMMQGIGNGFEATPLTTVKVADVEVQQFRVKMNVEAIAKAAAPDNTAPAPAPEGFFESQKAIDALWGKDGMQMSFASRDGRMVGIMGGDERDVANGLTRFATASTSPRIQRALDAVAHMNPCLAFQADLSKLARGLIELSPKLGAGVLPAENLKEFDALSKAPPILIYGGVDGRVWNLTVAVDVKKMMNAFAEPESVKLARARSTQVHADITAIGSALEQYAQNNAGKYPDSLEVIVTPDANGLSYLGTKVLPIDPWKHAYIYEAPKPPTQPKPRVYTLGADGKIGGEGEDADIDNLAAQGKPR